MNKTQKIEIIQEHPKITKLKNNFKFVIVKWILTAIFLFIITLFIFNLFGELDKGGILFLIIIGSLMLFAWLTDIKLFLQRKKKFGKNWKFFRDPLMKEMIAIIILILIICWLIFL
jgi:hypothetical protein